MDCIRCQLPNAEVPWFRRNGGENRICRACWFFMFGEDYYEDKGYNPDNWESRLLDRLNENL